MYPQEEMDGPSAFFFLLGYPLCIELLVKSIVVHAQFAIHEFHGKQVPSWSWFATRICIKAVN